MRRLIQSTILAGAVFALSTPTEAAAQGSDNLASSMTAFCVSGDCSEVRFTLDVFGSVYMQNITFQSSNGSLWLFEGLAAVFDSNGNDVTGQWFPPGGSTSNSQLTLSAFGFQATEPIDFVVDMQAGAGATASDLIGVVSYDASGLYDGNQSNPGLGNSDNFSTAGTVTPEPSTWLLLGTGLLGLGVAVRRRALEGAFEV